MAFNAAAAYLSSASSVLNVASTVKLELYGLFKYINVSSTPPASRPSIFDFTGRAKWDAWAAAGNTYSSKAEAESRYLEIARSLGWKEGIIAPESVRSEDADIWDSDDDTDKPSRGNGEPGGLGNSVSSMARPEDDESDVSLHGLAVSNHLQELVALVHDDPSVDPNARDNFGYTALHLAADRGHLPIVTFLLENGADRTIKDEDDLTAAELAQAAGHERIVEILSSSGL
ncbi:ankyrin repeat-containing domain protein [Mycena filopes]|nr:ankyrin repeat-containing domain protein [Mycena filopes]